MTTNRPVQPRRHPTAPFPEDDPAMFSIEYRYAEIKGRQSRCRAEAERERQAKAPQHPIRHRVGESIIRFGRKVGGDAMNDALRDASPFA